MKKYSSLLLIVIIGFTMNAQSEKNFKLFYKTCEQEKSIISISAPIGIANLFVDRKEKELRKLTRKIHKNFSHKMPMIYKKLIVK